jgi:hypothetical protein
MVVFVTVDEFELPQVGPKLGSGADGELDCSGDNYN